MRAAASRQSRASICGIDLDRHPLGRPSSTTAVSRLSFSCGKRRSNTVATLLSVMRTKARRPINCNTTAAKTDGDRGQA